MLFEMKTGKFCSKAKNWRYDILLLEINETKTKFLLEIKIFVWE